MKSKHIGPFLLTFVNVANVFSIRNLPSIAEFGLSSVIFLLIAFLSFFIPSALVSAELASTWPERGGACNWVKRAFGKKIGFLYASLVWIGNVFWYPTVLTFLISAFSQGIGISLSPLMSAMSISVVFWSITLFNLTGITISSLLTLMCVIIGTIIPTIFISLAGIFLASESLAYEVSLSYFLPNRATFDNIAYFVGVILSFTGMELSTVHTSEIYKPNKTIPQAIFLSGTMIMILSIIGTLAISIVIPNENINLASGSIEAIAIFLERTHIYGLFPILAVATAIGSLGGVNSWVSAPCKGLTEAMKYVKHPAIISTKNRKDAPYCLLIIQGILVTALSTIFILIPSINTSFWILMVISTQFYSLSYILMFIASIELRYSHPDTKRPYRIPCGNLGIWIVSSIGVLGTLAGFIVGFLPPSNLDLSTLPYFGFPIATLITLFSICCILIPEKQP